MKSIITEDFMLHTPYAKELYDKYARDLPIIDYHCHLSPQEIYEDKAFGSLTEAWLSGDHYKWRLMRAYGIPEEKITGKADDRDKFRAWAETLQSAIGNPLYHWSHLELKQYFDCDEALTTESADAIFDLTQEKLKDPARHARGLITGSRVKVLCTTDDPADDLRYHEKIAAEWDGAKVCPAWRPDRALNIEKEDFLAYLERLSAAAGTKITDWASLCDALTKRLDFFDAHHCTVSDHGLSVVPYVETDPAGADAILKKRLANGAVTEEERIAYLTALMLFLGREYARRGWVMQIHFGAGRNLNTRGFRALGADTGFDAIGDSASASKLGQFLDALDRDQALPKTILYSLNPNDNVMIESVMGCFQGETRGKLQHGSAWWFNDHDKGMRAQMSDLMTQGHFATFVGMLTDSRSFLSYPRHDYFRRILCDMIGGMVERGEYPKDEKLLREIIEGVCYHNAARYFGFDGV